ncbi:hypothetical protein ACFL23_02245 [Patescibacteria group bacterium]
MESILKNSAKYIFVDFIGDIFYFPLWWYSKGAKNVFLFCLKKSKEFGEYLALSVWIKNIFTPMYAQHDWQGRIISFLMRVVQIIFRTIIFIIWSAVIFILFILWLALPVLVVYQIYFRVI